jgi:hypothetical protein
VIQVLLYSPDGTEYDLTADSDHKLMDEATPDMEWALEDQQGRITDGMLSLTADNSTGWWDTHLTIHPSDRFSEESWASSGAPGVFFIRLFKNGVPRWEGDITDPTQVQYDDGDDARTVSFTVQGKLSRLARFNAGHVKRDLPEPFVGVASDRAAKPCVITLPTAASSYPIVPEDEFLLQKFSLDDTPSNMKVVVKATHAEKPELDPAEIRFKQRLKFDVNSRASVTCTTPYHRNKTALELCQMLLDHAEVPRTGQFLDAALGDIVVPYANFADKSVADALVELAACVPASVWADIDGYHVARMDTSMTAGPSPKNLDDILMRPMVTGLWSNYHSSVTVTGAKDRKVRRGYLTYPDTTLDISTDYMDKTADMAAMCTNLWQFYAFPRKEAMAEVADDGTAYRFWQDVTADGVAYKVVGIKEPVLSVDADCLSSLTLTLWECGASDLSAADAEDDPEADNTDPPPEPVLLHVTKDYDSFPGIADQYDKHDWPRIKSERVLIGNVGSQPVYITQRYRLWVAIFSWDGDLTHLADFYLTAWQEGHDRKKSHNHHNDPSLGPWDDGNYYFPFYVLCGNTRVVDVQAVYYDGQMSAEQDGVLLGYPDAVDMEAPTGDETPIVATLDGFSTYVDNVRATPKKECSAEVLVGLTANTSKKKVRAYATNGKGKQKVAHAKVEWADSSATVLFDKEFVKDESCTLDALEVVSENGESVWTEVGLGFVAGEDMKLECNAVPKSADPGTGISFMATPTGLSAPVSYAWDFGDGATSTSQNPSHPYAAAGVYHAQCEATDAAGHVLHGSVLVQCAVGAGTGGVTVRVFSLDVQAVLHMSGVGVPKDYSKPPFCIEVAGSLSMDARPDGLAAVVPHRLSAEVVGSLGMSTTGSPKSYGTSPFCLEVAGLLAMDARPDGLTAVVPHRMSADISGFLGMSLTGSPKYYGTAPFCLEVAGVLGMDARPEGTAAVHRFSMDVSGSLGASIQPSVTPAYKFWLYVEGNVSMAARPGGMGDSQTHYLTCEVAGVLGFSAVPQPTRYIPSEWESPSSATQVGSSPNQWTGSGQTPPYHNAFDGDVATSISASVTGGALPAGNRKMRFWMSDQSVSKGRCPSGGAPTGVEVYLYCDPGAEAYFLVTLLKNGSPVGKPEEVYADAAGEIYLGGETSKWGANWTEANVNSNQFGVQIKGHSGGTTETQYIHDIQMRVFHK